MECASITCGSCRGQSWVSDLNLEIREGEFLVLVGHLVVARPRHCACWRASNAQVTGESGWAEGRHRCTYWSARCFDGFSELRAVSKYVGLQELGVWPQGEKDPNRTLMIESILSRTLGHQDLLKRSPSALSGGQRQRVALGAPSSGSQNCS